MISFEEIKTYLPQYLSAESQNVLFQELKQFPNNMDRVFSSQLTKKPIIYQGDGMREMLVINLPSPEIKPLSAMILSNTCDIYPDNKRLYPSRIVYAPIFKVEKYKEMLSASNVLPKDTLDNHIATIKRQWVSNIFYLPKGCNLEQESIVFLDRLNNCPIDHFNLNEVNKKKIFTLSNYGFYMFLVKLSIHFTRIREQVDRLEG